MPLPMDGRKGCISFEERIFKLIATNQVGSPEYLTWQQLFGQSKMKAISEKFEKLRIPISREYTPDEDGWILVHPDEFDIVRTEDILEYGSKLPGGAIYLRLKTAIAQVV